MSDSQQQLPDTSTQRQPAFKPTILDKSLGLFVGANFSGHYTRQDARDINIYAPWTWVSVGMAATGIALALERYAGVPFAAAFFPAAAAYTCMDRTIIRAESIGNADRDFEALLAAYDEQNQGKPDAVGLYKNLQKKSKRLLPLLFRLAMASCTSVITGGVLVEYIARPEIEGMIKESYQADNQSLIQRKEAKETDYDKRIASLQRLVDDLRMGRTPAVDVVPSITMSPTEQNQFNSVNEQLKNINLSIGEAQKKLIEDQKLMRGEENGAALPGASQVKGQGKHWEAAKLQVDGDQEWLAQLRQQLRDGQRELGKITNREQARIAARQRQEDARSDALAAKIPDMLAQSATELKALQADRATAFVRIDNEMKADPQYKPIENETGIFADMKHLEDYLADPKTGAITVGFMRTVEMLIFLLETSAVLGAALRKPTSAEMQDAQIRAGVIGQIERDVMKELDEIIPMRKRLKAMAQTDWENMQGFYRPEKNPNEGSREQGPQP